MYIQKRAVTLVITGIGVAVATLLSAQDGARRDRGNPLGAVAREIAALSAKLDDRYVPFKVQIAGGLCDSALPATSNPQIIVDSDGDATFVVTSVLIKRAPQNPTDFTYLTLNGFEINGTFFETRTGNLFDPLFGEFAVEQSADLMGMPVRRGGLIDTAQPGGSVPHQITADGGTANDIRARLFCRSDNRDMSIEAVSVGGWKRVRDTISVTYVPGH